MDYIQVAFTGMGDEEKDIMIALLSAEGYEGFDEMDNGFNAYIPEVDFDEQAMLDIAGQYNAQTAVNKIEKKNWNEAWEKSFDPVVVDDFCTVRADFHPASHHTTHEIVITPKMSFGTGHHATTQLMIGKIRDVNFEGKRVFDFGTGTGILAILAEKLGASHIVAIDHEEWAYENTIENAARNGCNNIAAACSSLELVSENGFDVILANINRHILLQYMQQMNEMLVPGGLILMSGLLTEDKDIIMRSAGDAGFKLLKDGMLNNWIVLMLKK
jgi:ribosomal protein L11 methyltransferase